MQIGRIIKEQQPDTFNKLHKRKKKRKYRSRKRREQQLSFSSVDRLMRERADVDDRKCQGW